MHENAKLADRPLLFREQFHVLLLRARDACRGKGDVKAEMNAVGELIELTHDRIKKLEAHLKFADELLAVVEPLKGHGLPGPGTVNNWRERWAKLKERQL